MMSSVPLNRTLEDDVEIFFSLELPWENSERGYQHFLHFVTDIRLVFNIYQFIIMSLVKCLQYLRNFVQYCR